MVPTRRLAKHRSRTSHLRHRAHLRRAGDTSTTPLHSDHGPLRKSSPWCLLVGRGNYRSAAVCGGLQLRSSSEHPADGGGWEKRGGGGEDSALLLRMDFEQADVEELRQWIRRWARSRDVIEEGKIDRQAEMQRRRDGWRWRYMFTIKLPPPCALTAPPMACRGIRLPIRMPLDAVVVSKICLRSLKACTWKYQKEFGENRGGRWGRGGISRR